MANQRIAHGAQINAATPEEVAQIVTTAMAQHNRDDNVNHHRERGVVRLDGSGAGKGTLAVSPQFSWQMERISIAGSGAPSAIVQLFENDESSGTTMVEVIALGTAGLYSDAFSNNIWIPAGARVIIVVTGGAPNGDVTFNLQIKLVRHAKS